MSEAYPGWYVIRDRDGEIRWWSGSSWMGYTVKNGAVRPGMTAIGTGQQGIVSGCVALVMSAFSAIFVFRSASSTLAWLWAPMILILFLMVGLGLTSLLLGIVLLGIERMPAPRTAPLAPPATLPQPGEIEGPNPGWYPSPTPRTLRWWTGRRWVQYVTDGKIVRPTLADKIASRYMGWIAIGFVGLLAIWLVMGFVIPDPFGIFRISPSTFLFMAALGVIMWVARKRALGAVRPAPVGPPVRVQLPPPPERW